MPTCLVTGIGGSIGTHVYATLMERTGWDVVGIDSFSHMGISERVTYWWKDHPEWERRTRILRHDLTAPISDKLLRDIGPVDYIINLASRSDVFASIQDPVPFVQNNVAVMLNILEYARQVGPTAFIQVSTDEVYGPTDGRHLHKEWEPIVPSSPYSASKAAQEAIAISYWRAYGVPLIIVNLMNNFGEMQSPKKFPAIVQRKISNGGEITIHGTRGTMGSRAYIHSANTADALLFLLTGRPPYLHEAGTMDKPDRYNIPGDAKRTNEQLVHDIVGVMGAPVPPIRFEDFHATRPGHDRHYGLDGAKLWAQGWRSPETFEAGLRRTVKFQQRHPEWLNASKS